MGARVISQTIDLNRQVSTDDVEILSSREVSKYITSIDSNNGIQVHAVNNPGLNYTQIDSDGLEIFKSDGASTPSAVSIVKFGENTRIGALGDTRFLINSESLQAYNSSNIKYFEVSANGITYGANGANTVANTTQVTNASRVATNFLTVIENTSGISVHDVNDTSNYVNISSSAVNVVQNNVNVASFGSTVRVGDENNGYAAFGSSGMEVFNGSSSLASFGSTVRVGATNTGHTFISAGGMSIYGSTGNTKLADIGYGRGYNPSGTQVDAPYFTFGTRASPGDIGNYSFLEGHENVASGYASHAEGEYNNAYGWYSHAQNKSNSAFGYAQTVIGEYNKSNGQNKIRVATDYAFIIGNGTSNSARSNALTVDWGGNVVATSFTGSLIGNATTSTRASYACYASDGTLGLTAYSSNEINFLGSSTQTGVYIGYRSMGSTNVQNYYFCNSTGTTSGRGNIYCGALNCGALSCTSLSASSNATFNAITVQKANINMQNNCALRTTLNGTTVSATSTVYSMIGLNTSDNLLIGNNAFAGVYLYAVRKNTTTAAANMLIAASPEHKLYLSTASSRRYKKDIVSLQSQELQAQKLYDLPVRQFKYKESYLSSEDKRFNMDVPGFIAEEVYEYYPIAAELKENNEPEDWNVRYIVPPMLALVQEQHKDIEQLKEEIQELKSEIQELKQLIK